MHTFLIEAAKVAFSGFLVVLVLSLYERRRLKRERRSLLLGARDDLLHNAEALGLDWSPLVGFAPFRSRNVELALESGYRYFPNDSKLTAALAQALKMVENLRAATALFRDMLLGRLPEELVKQYDAKTIEALVRSSRVTGVYFFGLALAETEQLLGQVPRTDLMAQEWVRKGLAALAGHEEYLKNPFLTETHRALLRGFIEELRRLGLVAEAGEKRLS